MVSSACYRWYGVMPDFGERESYRSHQLRRRWYQTLLKGEWGQDNAQMEIKLDDQMFKKVKFEDDLDAG